jgi:predicted nucleic acid-binding protein
MGEIAMEIVVDTTVVIAVITNEAQKPRLIDLTRDSELVAPASLPWEVGNAFSAMFKQKRVTKEQALDAIAEYRKIAIRLLDLPIEDSVRISAELGIYAYDAYMIHCARLTGAPLLTLDKGLKAAAARAGATVLEVLP